MKNIEVALGCLINGNKVLLTRRNEKDIPNIHEMWELPGGKIELNESSKDAVVRELHEETGLIVNVTDFVPFHFNIQRNINGKKINIILNCHICELSDQSFGFVNKDYKILEIKWFDLKDLQFLKIMAGSREFLHWILKTNYNIKFDKLFNPEFGFISFENVDQKLNHKKKYQITIQFEPNAKEDKLYTLSCQFGKIDGKFQTKQNHYRNEFDLYKELLKRSNDRIAHGYFIEKFHNFPLKDWLEKNISYLKIKRHSQLQLNFN